jgi:hypothetical protein
VQAAWVQAVNGGWVVRAITTAATCPVLASDRGDAAMALRAGPVDVPARTDKAQPQTQAARFTTSSCELALPGGATRLQVGPIELKAPAAEIRRIVLVGDTGCRMKASEGAFQDCLVAAAWPWREVAARAAAQHPDLVVHVGDYHYRESPCPPGRAGCQASPWGYGDDTWEADVFGPAAPLLAAAPWVFVRGNHESCGRAGIGWMRYFDPERWTPERSCQNPADDAQGEFTTPYAVALSAGLQLIVFDSSFSAGKAYAEGDPAAAVYTGQLAAVAALARQRPHSWFVNHHPVLGFAGSDTGVPRPGRSGLLSVLRRAEPARYFAPGIDVVLNGHVHLFEALDFSSDHPAELVLGNSGSATEGHLDPAAAREVQPAPGAVVRSFVTRSAFGFATLDRAGDDWQLTEWSPQGQAMQRCRLHGASLDCE